MKQEKIICEGYRFTVYKSAGRYFVDEHQPIIHSYSTLKAVAEHCYYMGYIPSKDIKHLQEA